MGRVRPLGFLMFTLNRYIYINRYVLRYTSSLIFYIYSWCCVVEVLSNVFYQRELSSLEHVALTLLLVASSCTLSLLYDCLGWVMELNVTMHAHTRTYKHAHKHTRTHMHAITHTRTHAYNTHTHTHTH